MNHLQAELQRLYLPAPLAGAASGTAPSTLVDAAGGVRAMVLELAQPPDWEALSKVWRSVQTELELPAPAIAVSGTDGLQLWFSLTEPIAAARAHDFLERLRQRFLADIDARRVRLLPAADASPLRPESHARLVPACQESTGNWSAFLAPDLVPVFADTPWLDIPPGEEAQAGLLRGMVVTKQAVFEAALAKLGPAPRVPRSAVADATGAGDGMARGRPEAAGTEDDPERFLRRVMNDTTVALALRIEAAKALLHNPHTHRPPLGG